MSGWLSPERLSAVLARHQQLMHALASPDLTQSDREVLGGEFAHLDDIARTITSFNVTQRELDTLQELLQQVDVDEELKKMAHQEHGVLKQSYVRLEQQLMVKLLPRDDRDDAAVILEVRSGTGGIEAALFAAELYRMYMRYANVRHWSTEQLDVHEDPGGAIKRVVAEINGRGVYSRLKFESGVHRVQRIPATEANGRIHTSTASVVILAKPRAIDIKIDDKDLRIDTFRAQGAGGQHVNKTDSAVRITHIPTGVVAQCQDDKSQHRNKDRAMQVLRARLYDMEKQKAENSRAAERRQMIGGGDRSERIRTYNYPQGRITDHRIGVTLHKLERVLSGESLDELIDALSHADEAERLEMSLKEGGLAVSPDSTEALGVLLHEPAPPATLATAASLAAQAPTSHVRSTELAQSHHNSCAVQRRKAREIYPMRWVDVVALLREAGVVEPAREARYLWRAYMEHALRDSNVSNVVAKREKAEIHLAQILPPTSGQELPNDPRWWAMVERRCHREPFAYIVGKSEFYGRMFEVGSGVLIPRPETETLLDALAQMQRTTGQRGRLIDIGTGSGCIGITALLEGWCDEVYAIDISAQALQIAQTNAQRHSVNARYQTDCVDVLRSGWWEQLPSAAYNWVVSNPPYIPSVECNTLMPEVSQFEPRLALDGGADGCRVIDVILRQAPRLLGKGGALLLEIGQGQAATVLQTAKRLEPHWPGTWQVQPPRRDLQRIERVVSWQRLDEGTNSLGFTERESRVHR